jgi:hypothetical protein
VRGKIQRSVRDRMSRKRDAVKDGGKR